jgi:hypothetical protein
MNNVLNQLARTDLLWDENLKSAILAGDTQPTEEIGMAMLIGAMDAHAVILGDPQSSKNEKRLARMALATVFLAVMAVASDSRR